MLRVKLTNIAVSASMLCAAVALVAVLSSNAHAQTPSPVATTRAPAQTESQSRVRAEQSSQTDAADAPEADLSITARVTARELRFEKVPSPKVEFTGQPRRETVWQAERENLPDAVQPGVTYRNVGIKLRITSLFADIERIVAEALGEIPLSDDAPPAASVDPAPQTNAQHINASNPSPLNAPTTTTQRTRPARKGRGN